MKKNNIIIYFITFLLMIGCQNKKTDNIKENVITKLEAKQKTFNFGTLTQEDSIEHIFIIKNTGSTPLIVRSASASCGCTTAEIPKIPILPGKTSQFKVKFKPGNSMQGVVSKSIVLQANTDKIFHVFYLKGNVVKTS